MFGQGVAGLYRVWPGLARVLQGLAGGCSESAIQSLDFSSGSTQGLAGSGQDFAWFCWVWQGLAKVPQGFAVSGKGFARFGNGFERFG